MPVTRTISTLEREEEPAPLAVLGEVSEPGEVSQESLEKEAEPALEPAPLAALQRPPALETVLRSRRAFFSSGDLRRGVVLTEVFSPPVGLRS